MTNIYQTDPAPANDFRHTAVCWRPLQILRPP